MVWIMVITNWEILMALNFDGLGSDKNWERITLKALNIFYVKHGDQRVLFNLKSS